MTRLIGLIYPFSLIIIMFFKNYITYGPSSSLYGSLGPTNVSHTSSTLLLQNSAGAGTGTPSLIANPLLCSGPRQSPDIIGISTNSFVTGGVNTSADNAGHMNHVMTPAIVIGSGMAVCSSSPGNSNAMGKFVIQKYKIGEKLLNK